ncbi:MAG: putative O-glycosylation ligase, exosortase A system-associated [Gammaproteobacteria bacterium]|nr:putative O-glycosylation ligase, exosortase A system-associated [Gammaproteobacteria bacterium]
MRDIIVMGILFGFACATLWRPWLGVLALANISYMSPHAYAWGFALSFPAYQVQFIIAFVALCIAKERQAIPADWRVPVFFLLWFFFVITTINAVVPWAAWPKMIEVSKIYMPFLFTLILITDREKLFYLIIVIAASFGIVAAKGGLWALATGFANRVYGPPGTQFFENNAFAIATVIAIPLLILWYREATRKWEKLAVLGSIPLCYCAAISSWSRGGLLAISVVTLILLWHSKRKWMVTPLLIVGIYFAIDYLPEEWFARMETLETYQEDASANARLTVWRDGWNWAVEHPGLGGGFEAWRYVTISDWHSSYIEILAEHGFFAFFLWFSLLIGSIWTLTQLPRKTRNVPGMEWVANYSYMLRASLIAYAVGTVFLGLSYWDIYYHLVFITVLVRKFALQELAEKLGTTNRSTASLSGPTMPVYGQPQPK